MLTEGSSTALHWAARNGHADMVKHLAKRGANVQFGTTDGVNALAWAVFSGDIDTCRVLLDLGVDPLARNRWKCGLGHWAGATGSIELCRWLADTAGVDFAMQNEQLHDGLAKAAWNGHRELCEWLLERYPNTLHVSRCDRAGLNIADIAKCNGHDELSSWLSAHPSSLSRSSSSGSQKNVWLLPKEFTMYFRTQGVV